MRIAVYAIALNEEANVDGWARSIGDSADLILLADTGSTDDTVDRAESYGIDVHRISIRPFRFDDARNAALALLPSDIDVCVLSSIDIRFQEGWREKIEQAWTPGVTALDCWFEASGSKWRYPFAHARHGYRWRYPFHEALFADPSIPSRTATCDITFTAGPDRQSTPETVERNLRLLRMARAENPHEPRHLHYLGRELWYAKQYDEAIDMLYRHTQSGDWWGDVSESWILIGDCLKASEPIWRVSSLPYEEATRVAPQRREGWVRAAELHRLQYRYAQAREAAERALDITTECAHFNWPWAWGSMPFDEAALACHLMGDNEAAVLYGKRALELAPTDARLLKNLESYLAA